MTTSLTPLADAGLCCSGCGRMTVPQHPSQTVAAVRSVVARFGVLFRHADPDAAVCGAEGPGSRSAFDHASRVANDLAVLDRHLRKLLGEEHRAPADRAEPAAADVGQDRVLDALTRAGGHLTGTLIGATAADWQRAATISNRWVLDLIDLTLHDAAHELHDAEHALHAASAGPEPRGTARGQDGGSSRAAGVRLLRMR